MSVRFAERRVISAVFVDVVGSTALTVALGPERLKRALDRAFRELSAIIAAEGGTVEKYVGDAVHALFGAPTAHPDDPQRALQAAHACLAWAEARTGVPVPFAVRVGVETGEAIVDLSAVATDREQMSIGTCVNVAARLQQLAEPGQVLVGPTCHGVTLETAEFLALGALELKGLGRMSVWRLVRPLPVVAATPLTFVGREAELDVLRLAYRRAASGRSVLALISGPPGQGKTRLVDEFVAGVRPEAQLLMARCRPPGEARAQNPLRELLGQGDAELSRDQLAARLSELFHDPVEHARVLRTLAYSVGLGGAEELAALGTVERQDEITDAWRRFLAASAQTRPVVLWIEDLHWADPEVVRFVDRLTAGATAAVLIVATARPELIDRAGLRPGGDRFFLELGALDAQAARALARHAGDGAAHAADRAEGHPLFIIELARSRALASERAVPLTLQGVIGARLDELPVRDRELLQQVSVVGETFTVADAVLLAGRPAPDVGAVLERLADLQYLHRAPGAYRFQHGLVRDVAYGRLPTETRMVLHARYAGDGIRADDVDTRAHHLWEALGPADADWVWEERPEREGLQRQAFEAHVAAGRHHAQRFALDRAVEVYRRGLRFAEGPLPAADVERAMADVHASKGEEDEAWTHYRRACELHGRAGSSPPADIYPSLLELAVYQLGMFRQPPAEGVIQSLFTEGETIARRAADHAARARLLTARAFASGDLALLQEAQRLPEQAGDLVPFAPFFRRAATLQLRSGDFAAANDTFRRLDALAAEYGRADWAPNLEGRALLALDVGDLATARALARELVEASLAWGPHLRTHAYRSQCHVLLAQGNWSGLHDVLIDVERLVKDHPGTPFCYAVTVARAFAAVAQMVEGHAGGARALLTDAEAPFQAEPFDRESVLLLAYGVLGRRAQAERLIRECRERGLLTPPWYFYRAEAVALTMLEAWEVLDDTLSLLTVAASRGSQYLEGLIAAIREEVAAARGGPRPLHAQLRDLGYLGWSELVSFRPGRRS